MARAGVIGLPGGHDYQERIAGQHRGLADPGIRRGVTLPAGWPPPAWGRLAMTDGPLPGRPASGRPASGRPEPGASWLVSAGLVSALVLLFGVSISGWVELLFPAWILALSIDILAAGPRASAGVRTAPGA